MFSYRTIAGVGAAALAFMALTKVSRRLRQRTGESTGEYVKKAAGRVEGVIRRRTGVNIDPTNDVI